MVWDVVVVVVAFAFFGALMMQQPSLFVITYEAVLEI